MKTPFKLELTILYVYFYGRGGSVFRFISMYSLRSLAQSFIQSSVAALWHQLRHSWMLFSPHTGLSQVRATGCPGVAWKREIRP